MSVLLSRLKTLTFFGKEAKTSMRLSTVLLAVVVLMLAGSALGGVPSEEALQELIQNLPPGTYWDEDRGCLVHDPPLRLELPKSAFLTEDEDTVFFDDGYMHYSEIWFDPPDHFALTRMPTPECPPGDVWFLRAALLGCFNLPGIEPEEGTVAIRKHYFTESCLAVTPKGDSLGEMLGSEGFKGEPVDWGKMPRATWTQVDFDVPVPVLDTVFWLAWDYDLVPPIGGAWYVMGELHGGTKPEDKDRFFMHYGQPCPSSWEIGPWLTRAVGCCVQAVYVDIKPMSCPNPLNVKSQGVLPVAILGTEHFDVTEIDPASVRLLEVVEPIRWAVEDVAEPFPGELCDCWTNGPDGFDDFTLKFDVQQVVDALGEEIEDRDVIRLSLTWNLKEEFGGTAFEGEDCVIIIKKGKGGGLRYVGSSTPDVFALFQNNPNPFAGKTSISYALPVSGHTTLKIYDTSGRLVTTLVDAEMNAGIYSISWNRKNAASGIYFYRVTSGGSSMARAMTVIR